MKLDKNTIFSLFIVVLFVGSLFAMIAFSDNLNTGNNDNIPTTIDDNLEMINYTATFDANVNVLFPQILVAGKPLDFEEASINDKLTNLQGIKNKQIEFRPDQDGNINLIITLSIVLDKKEEIINNMKNLGIFENPEFYQYGMVDIPEKITFTNDQNQEIEYEFIKANMEGILGIETQKGDSLSVVSYVTFKGTELINSRAIEQVNNSNQFQMLVDFGTFNILEYKNQVFAQTTFNLNEDINRKAIENNIKNKYENTTFEYQMTKGLKLNIIDKNIDEINSKLETLKESELFTEYSNDENTLTLSLDSNLTSQEYATTKETIFSEINMTPEDVIEEAELGMQITFEYGEINTTEINSILDKEIKYTVLANVDTSNMVIAGKKYSYDQNTTEVMLDYPEDLNKTEIELNIQGYYQRNKLLYLGLNK